MAFPYAAGTATTSAGHKKRAATLLALLLLCWGAQASTAKGDSSAPLPAKAGHTWRCESAAGQITYSQQPCDERAALKNIGDPRSAAQQRQAVNNGLRDGKLARQLQRERRHQERIASLERPISLSGRHPGPHNIKASVNDHRPAPVVDQTRPIKVKAAADASAKEGGKATHISSPGTAVQH